MLSPKARLHSYPSGSPTAYRVGSLSNPVSKPSSEIIFGILAEQRPRRPCVELNVAGSLMSSWSGKRHCGHARKDSGPSIGLTRLRTKISLQRDVVSPSPTRTQQNNNAQENQLDHARQQHYPSLSRVERGRWTRHHYPVPARSGQSPKTTLSFSSFLFFLINQDTKMNLLKLGFRRQPKRTLKELFRPTSPAPKPPLPIRPDVDYPQHDERTPQAPAYTQMWLDHWSRWGDTKNPIGSPMESGA